MLFDCNVLFSVFSHKWILSLKNRNTFNLKSTWSSISNYITTYFRVKHQTFPSVTIVTNIFMYKALKRMTDWCISAFTANMENNNNNNKKKVSANCHMTRIVHFLFAPLVDDGCIKAPKQQVNNVCYYKYKYVWYTLSLRCLVLIQYL